MIKKAIKNSFTFALMLVQLIRIHKKINKVVRRTKKSEIPSIPIIKFKLNEGINKNFITNSIIYLIILNILIKFFSIEKKLEF